MSIQTWQETLITATADGPVLTAAAAASCINTAARITLPNNYFQIGKMLKVTLHGRISCAVTTPGTARFDVRLGGVVAHDSGAMNLNIAAKVNVPFIYETILTCRSIGSGTLATLMGQGIFTSEAVVGSPLPTVGSSGSLMCPVGAPAVGTGFDSTSALTLDAFFTQSVATGSLTIHMYKIESLN